MEKKKKRDFDFQMEEMKMDIHYKGRMSPHPGAIFQEILRIAKLNDEPANKIARILGLSRTSYYDFINERTGISPELAVRIALFFKDFHLNIGKDIASPKYWWQLNSDWLFCTAFENHDNKRMSTVGKIRYLITPTSKDEIIATSYKMELDSFELEFQDVKQPENTATYSIPDITYFEVAEEESSYKIEKK